MKNVFIIGTTPFDMTASVKSPSGVTELCDVKSLDDSHYSIKFVPKEMGVHTVSVKHKDMHIPGECQAQEHVHHRWMTNTVLYVPSAPPLCDNTVFIVCLIHLFLFQEVHLSLQLVLLLVAVHTRYMPQDQVLREERSLSRVSYCSRSHLLLVTYHFLGCNQCFCWAACCAWIP